MRNSFRGVSDGYVIAEGGWPSGLSKYIIENNVSSLRLERWREGLCKLPEVASQIKHLNISSIFHESGTINARSIGLLSELEELSVCEEVDFSTIDFDNLQHLKSLSVRSVSASALRGLNACRSLERLEVDEVRFNDLSVFSELPLKWLGLYGCKIGSFSGGDFSRLLFLGVGESSVSDFNGISCLENLRVLALSYLPKLKSIAPFAGLPRLQTVGFFSCKKIEDMELFSSMPALQRLYLSNAGKIKSLRFLEKCEALEVVEFWGDTNILDGDLEFFSSMESMRWMSFDNRRHYSTKCESMQNRLLHGEMITPELRRQMGWGHFHTSLMEGDSLA